MDVFRMASIPILFLEGLKVHSEAYFRMIEVLIYELKDLNRAVLWRLQTLCPSHTARMKHL